VHRSASSAGFPGQNFRPGALDEDADDPAASRYAHAMPDREQRMIAVTPQANRQGGRS